MTTQISPATPKVRILGKLITANMNSTADQVILLDSTNCVVTAILCTNATVSLTTAAGGFYTAASKGGSAIVAAGQVYSAQTNATLVTSCTIGVFTRVVTSQIFLSLTTGQGGNAWADVYVVGIDFT